MKELKAAMFILPKVILRKYDTNKFNEIYRHLIHTCILLVLQEINYVSTFDLRALEYLSPEGDLLYPPAINLIFSEVLISPSFFMDAGVHYSNIHYQCKYFRARTRINFF